MSNIKAVYSIYSVSIFYISINFTLTEKVYHIYLCSRIQLSFINLCLIALFTPSKSWLPTNACQYEDLTHAV